MGKSLLYGLNFVSQNQLYRVRFLSEHSRELHTRTNTWNFETISFSEASGRKLSFYIVVTVDDEWTHSPADIQGTELSGPFGKHTLPELCWWLLCRGIGGLINWRNGKLLQDV